MPVLPFCPISGSGLKLKGSFRSQSRRPRCPARECKRPEMVSARICRMSPAEYVICAKSRSYCAADIVLNSRRSEGSPKIQVVACSLCLILVAFAHCLCILPSGECCGGQQSLITNTSSRSPLLLLSVLRLRHCSTLGLRFQVSLNCFSSSQFRLDSVVRFCDQLPIPSPLNMAQVSFNGASVHKLSNMRLESSQVFGQPQCVGP